jgi:hypothetical protein
MASTSENLFAVVAFFPRYVLGSPAMHLQPIVTRDGIETYKLIWGQWKNKLLKGRMG